MDLFILIEVFRKVTSNHIFSLFPKGEMSVIYNLIARIRNVLKSTSSLSLKVGLLSKLIVLIVSSIEGEKQLLICLTMHTSNMLLTILIYWEVSAQETC